MFAAMLGCNTVHILVWLTAVMVGPAAECQEALIVSPARLTKVSEYLPEVTWRAIPGVSEYRVELESRVPDGAVLVSIDTHVGGTVFRPAQRLTEDRAVVKVRVTSRCRPDDGSFLRSAPASFFIDTAPSCSGPTEITLSANRGWIEWGLVSGATRFDVTLMAASDGQVIRREQTKSNRVPAPADSGPFIAVVRPYCATGYGPRASAFVATKKP
jgi:hypothetical protein